MNNSEESNYRLPGLEELADLRSFNPDVFLSDNKEDQEVCNFVLSLAIIYNDLKNLIWVHHHLTKARPRAEEILTRYLGEFSGFHLYAHRLIISLFHELLVLIKNKQKSINHKLFQRCVEQIPKTARDSWQDLVSFANGKNSENFSGNVYKAIRDKVTFHYSDTDGMNLGFRLRFTDKINPISDKTPIVSLGSSTQASRFYFADALIQSFVEHKIACSLSKDFKNEFDSLLKNTNTSLRFLVEHFIYVRKGAFHDENEKFTQ